MMEARLPGALAVFGLSVTRQSDEQCAIDAWNRSQLVRQLIAVHSRKTDIEQDYFRLELAGKLDGAAGVPGNLHLMILETQ